MKKNNKLILISVIIIGIMIVGLGIGYYILNNRDKQRETDIKAILDKELRLSDTIIEYGTEINLLDEKIENLDSKKDIVKKIYVGDNEITTYKFNKLEDVQFTEVNYTYYKNFLNQTKKVEARKVITYKVEDTKKPIIEGVVDKTVTVGDNIDLKEGITARDEVDGKLEIMLEGSVDTNTVGKYNVKVIAKDKNDNLTEDAYVVNVIEKQEVKKEKNTNNKINRNNSSKNSASTNSSNKSKSTSIKSQEEQSTYNYETYGNKIYFEEERGENGNYSEKFSW